jgi:ATP-binding cassette subfamily B protein
MLALVGPSIGGKTTIANLLAWFWDVRSGRALIRGRDIRDAPLSEVMAHISMVFRRVYLGIYRDFVTARESGRGWSRRKAAG